MITPRQIAFLAFAMGIPPVLLAPFAVLLGLGYAAEKLGFYNEPGGISSDWGVGGLLYCIGLPIWLSYLWAAQPNRSRKQLLIFWSLSAALNAVWVVFFAVTLRHPDQLGSPVYVWFVYGLFPAILLAVSLLGMCVAQKSKIRR